MYLHQKHEISLHSGVLCFRHIKQETLNRRETIPTLPSRYPYIPIKIIKIPGNTYTLAKEVANVVKKKKRKEKNQPDSLTHPPRNGH